MEQKVPISAAEVMQDSGYGLKAAAAVFFRRAAAFIFVLALARTADAQLLDHFSPLSNSENGVHLSTVSVSGMYSAGSGAGADLGFLYGPGLAGGRSLTTLQAGATFGFVRSIGRSALNISYSPSYVRGLRGVAFDSTNHALSISMGRELSAKWSASGSVNGILTDFNQLLFAGSQTTSLVTTPATFDEFAAAILTGRSANLPLTQAVNAAPAMVSPEQAFLYGGRILNFSASGSVSYAYSTRSSLNLSITTVRTQFFSRGSNLSDSVNGRGFSVPWTTTGAPSINWGYSLTPRTTVNASLTTSRTLSRFQDSYVSQAAFSIGRTMSSRWFLQGSAGTGWIKPLRQTFQVNRGAQLIYGAGIGYKLFAQTFVGSFNRSVSDVYGLGANATDSATGAWSWKRPGSSVSLTASFGFSRLKGPIFSNPGSWTGFIGAGKSLNRQLALSTTYSYIQFPVSVLANTSNLTRSGVIVSLSWSPSARR